MMKLRRALIMVLVLWCTPNVHVLGVQKEKKDKNSAEKEVPANKQLEAKACGEKDKEVKYSAETDKKKHPLGEATPDKALIYVLRPTKMGNKIQTKLAVDAEWRGVNRGDNYFFFTLSPGEHFFCSQAENRSVLALTVEAGKTYYIQQHVQMGLLKARNELEVMKVDEAEKKLKGLHPSTWKAKS